MVHLWLDADISLYGPSTGSKPSKNQALSVSLV